MDKLSVFYIVLAGVSWGSASLFVSKLRAFGLTPIQMAAIRNVVSAVIILAAAFFRYRDKLKVRPSEMARFAVSGVSVYLTSSFYYTAMEKTSPATSVVLMYTAPIIVMFVSWLMLGEKLTRIKAAATLFAFLGCGLVTGIIGGIKFSITGIIIGLLSGLAYSVYNISVKIEMSKGSDPVIATVYCFVCASAAALVTCSPVSLVKIVSENAAAIAPYVIGLGIFTGVFPYFMYTLASKKLPAGVAAAMASIEPMTATLVSVIFFHEKLDLQAVTGIILILSSVVLLSKSE